MVCGPGVPGVGASGRLDLFGLGAAVNGAPDLGDYREGRTSNQRAVQVDSPWGMLFAHQGQGNTGGPRTGRSRDGSPGTVLQLLKPTEFEALGQRLYKFFQPSQV